MGSYAQAICIGRADCPGLEPAGGLTKDSRVAALTE